MGEVKHILVAVDQFPQNKAALARTFELAHAHNARVTIVHITGEFGAQGIDVAERHLIEKQARSLARERVEDAIRTHDLGRITVDIRVEVGSPSSRVVDKSNDLRVGQIELLDVLNK